MSALTAPRPPRPSPLILSDEVRRKKRRIAIVTLLVPLSGTVAALALLPWTGFGWLEGGLLAGMYTLTIGGVEVGLHRYFSHAAFKCGRLVKIGLGVTGSMAAQGPIIYWSATHRRHHVHSDTPDDPHSPHWRKGDDGDEHMAMLRGLWQAHVGNMYTDHATNVTLFAKDMMRDPDLAFIDRHYRKWVVLGVLIPAAVGFAVTQTWLGALSGLLWGGLVRMFLGQHCYYANGSFAHMFGPRPFDTGDQSTNNIWFGVPTFGSAYQNNHHAFPSVAFLGFKWFQVDLGAWIIRAMRLVGLVWDVRTVTPEQMAGKLKPAVGGAAVPT
jgi:stearoyl-CoA desaturase (delta-9 desaturase)